MLGEIMNRNYGFTYEITANCNYHCEYCGTFRIGEKISDINVIDNVLYFLNQVYNNLDDTDTLTIQIMATIIPNIKKSIVNKYTINFV